METRVDWGRLRRLHFLPKLPTALTSLFPALKFINRYSVWGLTLTTQPMLSIEKVHARRLPRKSHDLRSLSLEDSLKCASQRTKGLIQPNSPWGSRSKNFGPTPWITEVRHTEGFWVSSDQAGELRHSKPQRLNSHGHLVSILKEVKWWVTEKLHICSSLICSDQPSFFLQVDPDH